MSTGPAWQHLVAVQSILRDKEEEYEQRQCPVSPKSFLLYT